MIRLGVPCVRALTNLAADDERVWLLDGDLADSYGATEFETAFNDRFLMCGIAEQNMVSVAAGMAACGLRPWVFSFGAFLAYRALDQVRTCVSQTQLPVVLVGSHAGGCAGRNGKTHQAVGDIAAFRALGGLDIWCPVDAVETAWTVEEVHRRGRPAYLRLPREAVGNVPGSPGLWRSFSAPAEDVLLTAGLATHWALEALDALDRRGIEVEVLHVASVSPLPAALLERIRGARRFYVLEDHVRAGGLADAVTAACGRSPDLWRGWPADWSGGSGSAEQLRGASGLDGVTIAAGIAHAGARS